VLFTTAMDTLHRLNASQVDHWLARKLRVYTEPALLIISELGYLALEATDVELVLSGHLHPP
jgi:DNA replication protein DnaC